MYPRRIVLATFCTVAACVGLALGLAESDGVQATPYQRATVDRQAQHASSGSVTMTHKLFLPLLESHGWAAAGLQNGGFEEDWGDAGSHDAIIFETDGSVLHGEVGNVFTPPGWVAWFRHGAPLAYEPYNPEGQSWAQPEVRDAWNTDPDRMHGGTKGQLLFTFWRIHDAGFLQQVTVAPGQEVRLSGWAHAWSNNGGPPEHPDDPNWSEGSHVGYGPFYAIEGTEGLDSGDQNVTFWLGIDPTGGTDPYAKTVVWGSGAHIYNEYHEVPTVNVKAEEATITVFLRSRTLWRFKHNDVYWDDIVLEVLY